MTAATGNNKTIFASAGIITGAVFVAFSVYSVLIRLRKKSAEEDKSIHRWGEAHSRETHVNMNSKTHAK